MYMPTFMGMQLLSTGIADFGVKNNLLIGALPYYYLHFFYITAVLNFKLRDELNLMPLTPKGLTSLPSLSAFYGNYTFSLDSDHHTDTLILSCSQYVLTYDFNKKSHRQFADSNGQNTQSVAYHEKSGKIYFYVNGTVKELPFDTLQGVKNLCTASCSYAPSRIAVNDKYHVCSNTNGYYLMSHNLSTLAKKYYTTPLSNWIDKQRGLVYVTGSGQMLYIIHNGKKRICYH